MRGDRGRDDKLEEPQKRIYRLQEKGKAKREIMMRAM